MKIKLTKFKSLPVLSVAGKTQKALVLLEKSPAGFVKSIQSATELIVDPELTAAGESLRLESGSIFINGPGEFEVNEVFIGAINSTADSNLDLVEIELDGVRTLFFNGNKEIDHKVLDDIGVVDVLVMRLAGDAKTLNKTVSAVDPQIVIPLGGSAELKTSFKSELGIEFESTDTFSANQADFASEDYVLRGVEIST